VILFPLNNALAGASGGRQATIAAGGTARSGRAQPLAARY